MVLTDAQSRVAGMLFQNDVCVRVSRRWGKTKLAEFLSTGYCGSGNRVAYFSPSKKYLEADRRQGDWHPDLKFFTSKDDSFRGYGTFDLVILDEVQMFDARFWTEIFPNLQGSRIIALGTTTRGAPSSKVFATLPFEDGWEFYSGGIYECYNASGMAATISQIKESRSDMEFKTQFLGY